MAEALADEDKWLHDCILCKQSMKDATDTVTVKSQGIQSFIKSSKVRGDNEVEAILRGKKSITVHKYCSKKYNTKEVLKKFAIDTAQAQPSTSTRRSTVEFDFANNCFYCGNALLTKKSNSVSHVTTVTLKNALLAKYSNTNTSEAKEFRTRISLVPCLVQVGAAYHRKCQKKPPFIVKFEKGYDSSKKDIVSIIVDYIANKPDEAQFCVSDILKDQENINESPNLPPLKYKLKETCKCEFIIQIANEDIIISRMSLARNLLLQNYEMSRMVNSEEKRLKKIDESSAMCLEDIKNMEYDMKFYPPQDKFLQNSQKLVPVTLRRYLFNIISKHKSKPSNWDDVVNSIAHAIIAATRPSSFLSPVLVNIASVLHRMFASKELIDLLHSNGFCASYNEVRRYLSSVISHEEVHEYTNDAFSQLIYDNADHNVETADGRGTLHVMGGIQIITPKSAISESRPVLRLKCPLTSEELAHYGKIEIQRFQKQKDGGFKNINLENIEEMHDIPKEIKLSKLDFCWMYGRSALEADNYPGYRGYMEKITKHEPFQVSKVKILPFINAPASHVDTIYTSLYEAEKLRKKLNQEYMFITYDSPLFWKSQEVKTHFRDFDRLKIRIGGFHLWFSFASSIFYIMDGSGLRELFCELFAENSCDKVLNGTAYSRSVRAHLLAHAVLGKLIIDACNFTEEEKQILNNMTSKEGPELREYLEKIQFQSAYEKFHGKLDELETRGPTARLWVLYFKLLTVMKLFIEAERSGNFDLHLESSHRMVSIFIATGHFQYVKCLLLYLQQMISLRKRFIDLQDKQSKTETEEKEVIELENFLKQGYFTIIRRTDKFFSGTWSDMVIEQSLMRSMKTRGGLTHGRGVTESVQAQWTLATPALVDMSEELQAYSNVSFAASEQHKDSKPARMKKDFEDFQKILKFFKKNNPFPVSTVPVSLSTGIMGDSTINCHKALEVGQQLLRDLLNNTQTFDKIKFLRKNQVIPLQAAAGKIVVENEEFITANPTLVWQRVTIAVNDKKNLDKYLAFELAPYPVALFENGIMRKTNKSKFIDNFEKIGLLPSEARYVIDGGYLLHKVVWPHNFGRRDVPNYGQIADLYIKYVHDNFSGSDVTVVFDGYENIGTKSAERIRRKVTGVCRQIDFSEQTPLAKTQADFFSNDENKNKFILFLMGKLMSSQINVLQAKEDADTLIVETAISNTTKEKPSVIVGSDTDLLVIMTQRTPINQKVYFLKDVKGDVSLYDSDSFIHKSLRDLVLFLYSFSGCDTTSAFFSVGKNKLVKVLVDNEQLASKFAVFNNPKTEKIDVATAGYLAVMAMYGGKPKEGMTLNKFRYHCYNIGVSNKRATFDLKRIPPSESATIMHAFRVYYQIQLWFGRIADPNEVNSERNLIPTNWGWKFINNMFKPVYVDGTLLPDELLKSIRCNCKSGCKSNCGCKKHGMRCSDYCGHCRGLTCDNKQEITDLPGDHQIVNEQEEIEACEQTDQNDESRETEIIYDIPTYDDNSDSECDDNNAYSPPVKRARLISN